MLATVLNQVPRVAFAPSRQSVVRMSTSPSTSFIEKAKAMGANALLGMFTSKGGFDSCLRNMKIDKIEEGYVECSLLIDKEHANSYNTLHGGLTATIVDVAGTLALLSKDPTRAGVSVDMNITYMNAAKVGEDVVIKAAVQKSGKTLGFTQVDIFRKSDGKIVASGRHTKAL
eukprot:Colp12_sorted_trinity150504_noHs@30876